MSAPMIDRDTERRRIECDLAETCHYAKRQMPKVGTVEHPTTWDATHEYLNELLDELDQCMK